MKCALFKPGEEVRIIANDSPLQGSVGVVDHLCDDNQNFVVRVPRVGVFTIHGEEKTHETMVPSCNHAAVCGPVCCSFAF